MPDRPKLLIISPSWSHDWWGGGKVLAPPLSLPLLAGLTPLEFNIRLIDENIEQTDVHAEADCVAISCMTASAPRAYELAKGFRARGIPVVIGGIHPTVMPDEAKLHADAVVVGEAEPVWQDVLADLARGKLKPRYQQNGFCDLVGLPLPRRDLLNGDRYLTINTVQTARGCPNNCSFCSVSTISGSRYRPRPIPEVIEEVKSLRGWIGFVDDNIVYDHDRAKELFKKLIPLKIRWVGQGDLSMADDTELLKLAVLSGCHAMFIGIESVTPENLKATHKIPNIDLDMSAAIGKIHGAGIEIIGSFVFGLDHDDKSAFARTLEFTEQNKLVAAQGAILTPFPGTKTRRQLEEEGRILHNNWEEYTMGNVVYIPKLMTPEELTEGQSWFYHQLYSFRSILKRNLTTRKRLGLRLGANLGYRGVHFGDGLPSRLPKHQDG